MSKKKVLLLVTGLNTSWEVGEKFMDSMTNGYPHDKVIRYSIVFADPPKGIDHIQYENRVKKLKYNTMPFLSLFSYWKARLFYNSKIANEIEEVIKEEKIDTVWAILNSPVIISVVNHLSKKIDCPIITQVWDTPEYIAKGLKFDPITIKMILNDFANIQSNRKIVSVVSESMGRIYKKKYGVDSVAMTYCPPLSAWRDYKGELNKNIKEIAIVFAGSMYAYKEWYSLLDAIELNNNDPSRKYNISVNCLGTASRWAKKRNWVKYFPHLPLEEASSMVNAGDIAYLPYWLDKKHTFTVKTAFPSKMSFYTSAGTPIFYHGPKDSTPSEFLLKYKVGLNCDSKDSKDILFTIDKLISKEFLLNYCDERNNALCNEFHPEIINRKFQYLIENN